MEEKRVDDIVGACCEHGDFVVCSVKQTCPKCGGKGCNFCSFTGWVAMPQRCPKCGRLLEPLSYAEKSKVLSQNL